MPANGHKAALPKPALAPRSRTRGGCSSSKKLAVYMLVGGASALMLIEARRLWPAVAGARPPHECDASHVDGWMFLNEKRLQGVYTVVTPCGCTPK